MTYEIVDGHIKSLETTLLNADASVKVAPHVAGARAQPPGFDDTVDLPPDPSDIDSDAKSPSNDGFDDESDGLGKGGDPGVDDTIDLSFDPLGDDDDDDDDVVVKMEPGMDPDFQNGVGRFDYLLRFSADT